jgi:hypothetical protein
MLFIIMAEVGGKVPRAKLPLCQIEAKDSDDGFKRLAELLRASGIEIEAKHHCDNWLKWENTTFTIQGIVAEVDLGSMLDIVRTLNQGPPD